jgi:signal transduction histidine kinase
MREMERLQTPRTAIAAVVVTVALELAAVGLSWWLEPLWDTLLYAGYTIGVTGVGALIATREPRNPVAWAFVAIGVWNAAAADASQGWALRATAEGWPGADAAALVTLSSWLPQSVPGVILFLTFPDGRLTDRRWLSVVAAAVIGAVAGTVGFTLSPGIGGEFASGVNPVAVEGWPIELVADAGLGLAGAAAMAAVVSLALRLRRSAGIQRQQLKWFAFAAFWAAAVPPLVAAVWYELPWLRPLTAVALTGLPVAAAIAIFRYRLYDIDLLISRTFSYTLLTGLLGTLWAGTALLLGQLVGRGEPLAVAGATAATALAFRPLRDRIQDAIDHRFRRARFAALRRIATFEGDLRAGLVPPEALEGVLREVLRDQSLALRFHRQDGDGVVDAYGQVQPQESGDRQFMPIQRGGVQVGYVSRAGATSDAVLDSVLASAGLAIEITRLRLELRHQLDEVTASRSRIVAAAEQERRHIERDLHDGAQQRFIAIGLALRHAQHQLTSGKVERASRTLDQAVNEIGLAVDELRELARGLRPACLDEASKLPFANSPGERQSKLRLMFRSIASLRISRRQPTSWSVKASRTP